MPGVFVRDGPKAVLGLVHLQPLPGTPFYVDGSLPNTIERAVRSARALRDGGADGCLVQTVDRVYRVDDASDPARTAAMAVVVHEVRQAVGPDFHVGVQLMRNAIRSSLAVAVVSGGSFIRAGALVGATMTPHGLMTAEPLAVADYRRHIDAGGVRIFADIDSAHFQWYGDARSTPEIARHAVSAGADAVVVGGPDEERTLALVAAIRISQPDVPIVLAGNTNHDNAGRLLAAADGAFVGTCLEGGRWGGDIDRALVRSYVAVVRQAPLS